MTQQAYVDGAFVPLEEATVSVRDRGFLFGDGVYDVVRIANGGLFRLDAHLDRLLDNARQLEFGEIPEAGQLRTVAERLLAATELDEGKLYVQMTRGAGPRAATFPDDPSPTVVMYVDAIHRDAERLREEGVRATLVPEMRWKRCDVKSVNLLPKVLMKERARRSGCYEALFASESGVVWEGTSTNVFVVEDGGLRTTEHEDRVLSGITREEVFDIAVEEGIPVQKSTVRVDDLYEADELFLTGTLTGILGVVEVDGRPAGGGTVGPVTDRVHEALVERMQRAGEET